MLLAEQSRARFPIPWQEVQELKAQIAHSEFHVAYLNESLTMREQVKETGSALWGFLVMFLPTLGLGGVLDRILAGKKYAKEKAADAGHYYKIFAHLAKLADGMTPEQQNAAAKEQNELGIKEDIDMVLRAEGLSSKAA